MDTSFALNQTRCYQQAARLMAKGVSLSVALRGCLHTQNSRPSRTKNPPGTPAPEKAPNRHRAGVLAEEPGLEAPE